MISVNTALAAWNPNRRLRGWCGGKVRPVQGNAPQGRLLRGPDSQPLKERLRRSHPHHPVTVLSNNTGAPSLRFPRHGGIYQSDAAHLQPNPGAEAGRLPPVGPEAQVEERAGRNTLSLIVPMSSGRLFLDRVGRHQSPSPLHRHAQTTTHFPRGPSNPERSTLLGTGTFYFALTPANRASNAEIWSCQTTARVTALRSCSLTCAQSSQLPFGNKSASWIFGARFSRFMICVTLARVTKPSRARSACR